MSWTLGRYAGSAALVRTADEGTRVALALLALERLDSAGLGGALVAVLLVPHVLAAPVVGLLADRSRRPGLLIGAAAAGFGAALVVTAIGLGRVPTGLVLAVLLAAGCCGPALTGALSSRLGTLVPPERLPRAFGLDSLTYNVAGIAGPAVAAVLAGTTSAGTATLVIGAAAVAGGLGLATLPAGGRTGAGLDLLAGAKAIARQPVLATTTVSTSLGALGAGMLPVVAAVVATRAGDPPAAGVLLTALAAGGLAGSLLWTRWPAPAERAPRWIVLGLAGSGLPLLAGAAHCTLPVVGTLLLLAGIADGPLFGALLTARQRWSPPDVRGQVFTLGASAKTTAAAAGAALAGMLSAGPAAGQLAVAGAVPVLAAAAGAVGFGRAPAGAPAGA